MAPIRPGNLFDGMDKAMESLDRAMEKMDDIFDGDFDSIRVKVDGVKGDVSNTIQRIFKDRNNFSKEQRKELLKSITDVGKSVKIDTIKNGNLSSHEFSNGKRTSTRTGQVRAKKAIFNLIVFAVAVGMILLFVMLLSDALTPEVSETPPALMETVPPADGEKKAPEEMNKL